MQDYSPLFGKIGGIQKLEDGLEAPQVKSRQRVSDHGEVFTSPREVTAMLDLVKQETERIDSRFLEPACGHGNFLTEILRRKLDVVEARYKRSQFEYERNGVMAVSSIYGIDLLPDNIKEARERLLGIFTDRYSRLYKNEVKAECLESVRYILDKNIIVGDALDLMTVGDYAKPIVFSEWSSVNGSMIKRRDYIFENLVANIPLDGLFSDLGDQAYIHKPINEFPAVHFLKIANALDDS